jgi:tRNA-2-methylthio-N6-dimethylallyladenosine synthase/ribosomal protein S12 methylthiotransferase
VPYFDVPLQHAHPDVLRRMGRPFAADPRETVDRIREAFPEAALRTSLIVGFPGETEAQFETLRAFVRAIRFTHLGVFAFEPEEGTTAAAMPGQLPGKVKRARKNSIMRAQAAISAKWLKQFLGRRLPVLVDAPHPDWPGLYAGRAWFQAPEIDGIVYVSGPGVTAGALIEADIVETRDYDLVALA